MQTALSQAHHLFLAGRYPVMKDWYKEELA